MSDYLTYLLVCVSHAHRQATRGFPSDAGINVGQENLLRHLVQAASLVQAKFENINADQ